MRHRSDESNTESAQARAISAMFRRAGGKMKPVNFEDDELLKRTKHVRRRGESLMQFFARSGLGAAQLRKMSHAEIEQFVALAERNRAEEAMAPEMFEAKPQPRKFVIDLL